jgi:hypothetical protein
MGTDYSSFCGWLYDASKFIPSFAAGTLFLWMKDAIETGFRKKRVRRALWESTRHEQPCHISAGMVMAAMQSAMSNDLPTVGGGHDDSADPLLADARMLDPDNAAAYSRLIRAEVVNQRAANRLFDAIANQHPDQKPADVHAVIVACFEAIGSFTPLAGARLAVLRVLQTEEKDQGRRALALTAAEDDEHRSAAIDAEARSLLRKRGILAPQEPAAGR